MPASKSRTPQEIEQRQNAATKHGGYGAEKALRTGEPFKGIAAEREAELTIQLQNPTGRYEAVLRNAARVQTATDLLWNAVQDAGEGNDIKRLISILKTWGWMVSKAGPALDYLRAEQEALNGAAIDYENIIDNSQE